jgi:ATP-dependent exoDNAse (exonuclease V) beta subunit
MEKGIFTPLKTNDLYTKYPVLYKAEEISEKPLEIAERKRLLYVALTRAREKLYVVGTGKSIDALQSSSPNAPTSFLSWVHSSQAQAEYLTAETEEFEEYEDYTPSQESVADLPFEEAEEFVYPFEESVKIPRKLSVSALEQTSKEKYKTTVQKKDFLTTPRFATETKKVSAAEIGTANHTFMQFASFENCVNMGVEYEGDRLLMEEMITAEQYKLLNFKSLRRFFQSPLWKRISKSNSVFREKRFTVANNSHDLLGVGNETVLVQGVIDLFFENEDGTFTVVDYKTDKIKKGEEHILMERYKGQLSYYASAVKEMTEKDVKECIIYSFALDKEILLPL